jgi:Relaxase/Mobilisation nuclease domain
MIPKASQRGLGQDLATHLQNAYDNEYVEIAEVRGAVAHDLHGAFAEWELCAHAMTGCRNYLYSLSVNPDPAQDPLTREQYLDYIDRAEGKLSLSGQPRAIVFHIKEGREHYHVVWSRIDTGRGKAIHQAFDRQKLMMVTRQFAREHGLLLPEGMVNDAGRDRRKKTLSLYEKHQQDATGLTKEERIAQVTQAWRQSDGARAFVRALEELGYVLATGKRPYVLVDLYGEMNALPKLIDDKQVRTNDIRAFLERDFPPESLPSVEEAKALVASHRKAIEDFGKAQARADRVDALKASQAERRRQLEDERSEMKARHSEERNDLPCASVKHDGRWRRLTKRKQNALACSGTRAGRRVWSRSWRG